MVTIKLIVTILSFIKIDANNCIRTTIVYSQYSSIMIVNCAWDAMTLLEDGRICQWSDKGTDIHPEIEDTDAVSELIVCPRTGSRLVVTQNNRIFISLFEDKKLRDITDLICEVLGRDANEIIEVHIDTHIILARTENSMCIMTAHVSAGAFPSDHLVCAEVKRTGFDSIFKTFTSSINLVSFGCGHGFVRTDDDCLYSFGSNAYCELGIPYTDTSDVEFRPVCIDRVACISQIICGFCCTLLLMECGSVHASGLGYGNQLHRFTGEPFTRILFPDGTRIARVVVTQRLAFFITTDGLCYYIDSDTQPTIADGRPRPILLRALQGYFVENVFNPHRHIAVQYGEHSCSHARRGVCLLSMIEQDSEILYEGTAVEGTAVMHRRVVIDPAYHDGSAQPVCIPFFDGKNIVSVAAIWNRTYFTTDDGRAYSNLTMHTPEPQIDSIPFFDDNPIAIKSSAMRIRSAASMIGPDV